MARQGPHQAAQKSTNTGCSALRTSWSKFESVTSTIPFPAIVPPTPKFYILQCLYASTTIGCDFAPKVAESSGLWLWLVPVECVSRLAASGDKNGRSKRAANH